MTLSAGWVLYRNYAGDLTWHWWEPVASASLCGKAERIDRVLLRREQVDDMGDHHVCIVCERRERKSQERPAQGKNGGSEVEKGEMTKPAGWVLYRSVTGEERWHYWPAEAEAALCGKARRVDRVDASAGDRESDTRPACKVCVRRRHQTSNLRSRSHDATCACERCRFARQQGARRFVAQVQEDIAEIVCGCVRKAVAAGAWGDRETSEQLHKTEDQLLHRLFFWEITGGTADCQDAGEARTVLLQCWERVVQIFNVRGEEHTCREHRTSA